MELNDKCSEKGCGGDTVLCKTGGWASEGRLVCSNPDCPGKKLPQNTNVKLPSRGAGWQAVLLLVPKIPRSPPGVS